MGNLKLASIAVLQLMALSLFAQSITVASNINGEVIYNVVKQNKGDLVFTFLGDGDFTISDYPVHEFDDNTGTYVTESLFMKAYDLNPPKNSIVNTGATSGGNKTNNATRAMTSEIEILTSWCPAYGTEDYFIVAFTNINSANPVDGCIELHYKTNDLSVSYSAIRNYSAATGPTIGTSAISPYDEELKWTFKNLQQHEVRYLYVPAFVKLQTRKPLKLKANYFPNCEPKDNGSGGGATTNYNQQVAKYPHDPNAKIPYPECLEMYNDFQHFEYKLTFFNDGEAPANTVVLKDTLPYSLDPGSVVITGYEFAPTLNIVGQELTFTFTGINLPGLNQDDGFVYTEDDVTSFVSFTVCTQPPITNCILNQATIYFDAQPGVTTEMSEVCIAENCLAFSCENPIPYSIGLDQEIEIQETRTSANFSIYPNPFTDGFTISAELAMDQEEIIDFNILDTTGRLMKKWKESHLDNGKLEKEIYLNDLPPGLYFLVIDMPGNKVVKKIMKY